jgi:hypothetical protein
MGGKKEKKEKEKAEPTGKNYFGSTASEAAAAQQSMLFCTMFFMATCTKAKGQ